MSATEPTLTRERPSWLQQLFLRAPVLLYRGWLAELLRWRCVLLLTTTGRTSGLPRTTGVSFLPVDTKYVIFSGWGIRSDWYRNVRANPDVVIQVGRRRIRATAQLVEDPARRQELMLRMRDRSAHCGPPRLVRPVLRFSRLFDYDQEIAMAVERSQALPVVELSPIPAQAEGSP